VTIAVQNGGVRPDSTVGVLAAALVAAIVVGALVIAFTALAGEQDEPPPSRVVTIRG
jgi:hypothetical protein